MRNTKNLEITFKMFTVTKDKTYSSNNEVLLICTVEHQKITNLKSGNCSLVCILCRLHTLVFSDEGGSILSSIQSVFKSMVNLERFFKFT